MRLLTPGSLELTSTPRLYIACISADSDGVQRAVLDELQSVDADVFIAVGEEPELDQWRLSLMESAKVIGLWIDSPSEDALLELGLGAKTGKLVVGCPTPSGQRALVEPICARYGVPLVGDAKLFASVLRERLHTRAASSPSA